MTPKDAKVFYEQFLDLVRQRLSPARVKDGQFGAMMNVLVHNDGFTVQVDSSDLRL